MKQKMYLFKEMKPIETPKKEDTTHQRKLDLEKRVKEFCKTYNITAIKTISNFVSSWDCDNWEKDLLENPYLLMKASGNGFTRADGIATKLNFPHDHEYRILAFVNKALEDLSKGSTILNLGVVFEYIESKLEIKDHRKVLDTVLNKSNNSYKFLDSKYKRTTNPMEAIYITKTFWIETESKFYSLLKRIQQEKPLILDLDKVKKVKESFPFKLNEGQDKAIDDILKNNINVLTGLGGTGKSSITKAILQILSEHNQTFTCLAPTGIASKNFSKLTGCECNTIHKLHYDGVELNSDFVVLEESSMLSVDHIHMLLGMIGKNTPKLLFIGDVGQLAPISPSAPFRDLFLLIENGKIEGSVIELTEIMRASNELFIPHLCKMFTKHGKYDANVESQVHKGVTFYPLQKDLPKQILDIVKQNDFNFKETYILSPQNVGDYGCGKINKIINDEVAGKEILYKDKFRTYREGSELLHNINNREMDIYNGERVTLLRKEGDSFVCQKLENSQMVYYDLDTLLEQTQLSYGLTVHKTQSITATNVIMIVTKNHHYMNTKNLVYTGLSRASKNLCIIYDEGALQMASQKNEVDKRITFLGELAKLK